MSLDVLLEPRSIALVGASGRPDSLPGKLLGYLLQGGFDGPIYPVNPRYDELAGLQVYPSLLDIGQSVDLVLVMVPGALAAQVVDQCGEIGAAVAVLFGSGFGETGVAGVAAEADLVARARRAGVRLLGPNCQGVISGVAGLLASFTPAIDDGPPPQGPIAYVGQSGALGGSFLDKARERHLPVGTWVSTGNQADITAVELATAVVAREDVQTVALYLEDVGDGAAFVRLAREARRRGKDLVVVRSGASEVGRRAIRSHTGAMVSPHRVFETVARAEGVLTAGDIDEMLDLVAGLLSDQRPRGSSVGIVTSSGGAGILVVDQLSAQGFTVPELGAQLQSTLQTFVPDYGATQNPVDVTAQLFASKGNGDRFGPAFRRLCEHVAGADEIDVLVIVLTMLIGAPGLEMAEALDGLQEQVKKPVVVVWLTSAASSDLGRRRLAEENVPVFGTVSGAATALAALHARYGDAASARDHRPGTGSDDGPRQELASEAADTGAGLGDLRGRADAGPRMLDRWGIAQPAWCLAADDDEAAAAAGPVGGPLAVKLVAEGLDHKTELGGVALDVSVEAVRDACVAMRERVARAAGGPAVQGFQLQAMASPGLELLLAVRQEDPTFPPILTVGFGGVATEIYADVASAPLPLGPRDAERMLRELRAHPLLDGFRGQPRRDVPALIEAMQRLAAGYARAEGALEEVEINPIIVHDEGAGVSAVDVVAVWRERGSRMVPEGDQA